MPDEPLVEKEGIADQRALRSDDGINNDELDFEQSFTGSDLESLVESENHGGEDAGEDAGKDAGGADVLVLPPLSWKCGALSFTMWLLFDTTLPKAVTREERMALKRLAQDLIQCVPNCQCSQTRIVHAAIRLGDVGMWDAASGTLSAITLRFPTNTMNTDAKIHTCSFIIDRMYSQSYVRYRDEKDSADLGRAVQYGRMAVLEALAAIQMDQSVMSFTSKPFDERNNKIGATLPPEPITTLFGTNHDRLDGARLCLARALALLAQHIGLGATDPFTTKEVADLVEDEDGRQYEGRSVALLANGFFQEALDAVDALFRDLSRRAAASEEELSRRRAAISVTLFNMKEMRDKGFHSHDNGKYSSREELLAEIDQVEKELKTLNIFSRGFAYGHAVLGELFYCAASANATSSVPILASRVQSLVKRSITRLRYALECALDTVRNTDGLSIQAILGQHRSLVLFFIRSAKDLGKVYKYASNEARADQNFRVGEGLRDGLIFFNFALVLSLNLYGEHHPSVANIRRLAHQRNLSIESKALEAKLNSWLAGYVNLYYAKQN